MNRQFVYILKLTPKLMLNENYLCDTAELVVPNILVFYEH